MPAFPQPLLLDLGLQGASRQAGDIREECFGQALAGLAVGTGFCGAGALSPRHAICDQAGDGGAAGVVRTQNLTQEDPEGDQRGKDSVQPLGIARTQG